MFESKLVVKDLHKKFVQGGKTLDVLSGVNAFFDQEKSYAITGVSGSGKSTFMHILGGLDSPDSGQVLFNKQDLAKFSTSGKEVFLNAKLGFIFQFHYLIKELSVIENIMLPGLIKGDSRDECLQKARKLLQGVDLMDKIDSYPTLLSGGQQQRVSILRAIFNKPAFLLADEPTGNLDEQNAAVVVDLLLKCKKEWGMGLIVCSHDSAVYNKMNTVLRLHNGILA